MPEEKKPGARLQGGNQENQQGRRTGAVVAAGAAAVLCAAYAGLCVWTGGLAGAFPNVSIAGQDVSGLTREEIQSTMTAAQTDHGGEIAVELRHGDWTGTLTADQLSYDWSAAAQEAFLVGRSNPVTRGGAYLAHRLGLSKTDLPLPQSDGAVPEALEAQLEQADQAAGSSMILATYQVSGDQLTMTKGKTGPGMDRTEAVNAVSQAMNLAFAEKLGQGKEGVVTETAELTAGQVPPQAPDFDAIHRELYSQAKDAAMNQDHQIEAESVGVDFNVDDLRSAYEAAGEGETFSIPLTITQPNMTKAALESKLFRDVLGSGTTNVSGSANRKSNVKLSASACNGVILLPGEVFSYNNTTGSRSASKGYLAAPVYSGGASVDEVGGGTCQVSSTIYYAVLHTNLKIVERKNHRYNTGYVDPGMDATVYYGSTDFRFENSTNYPIKIVTQSYDEGGKRKLTVKIYGTNDDGVYAVPKSQVYDEVTPTTKYVADSSVPRGTLVLDRKQNAYTGKSATTTRYIYDKAGNLLEKQNMGKSVYQMRPRLYHYNPADGDPSTWTNGQPPAAPAPAAPTKPETGTDAGAASTEPKADTGTTSAETQPPAESAGT